MKKLAVVITLLLIMVFSPILKTESTRYSQAVAESSLISPSFYAVANRIEDSWLKTSHEVINLTQATSLDWLKLENDYFIIAYQPGYDGDARKILEFATYAQEVAVGPKFSYKPDKKTTIYIYLKPGVDPAPRSWGHAGANPNEAEMYFLSPSEAIKVSPQYNDEWFLRNVIHEYTHVVVARSRYLAIGHWDYFLPQWFNEGLAEYFAIFHSTPSIRKREGHQIFVDLSSMVHEGYGYLSLITENIYGRSAYVAKYLYDTLGEKNVAKLLWSKAPTFHEALKKELNLSFREFEENWLKWACEEVGADYDKLYGEAPIVPPSERIVLSPSSGLPGTVVDIKGFGFASSTSGIVWFDTNCNRLIDVDEPSVSVTTDDTGTFTATLILPSVDPDLYYIRADIPLDLPIESSALFTVLPSVLKPVAPYIIFGESHVGGDNEFIGTIRSLAGSGSLLGGYPLVKGVEKYITEIKGSNSIFVINASSVNDLMALKELDKKYPYLLPLPYEELRYYPLPLICFAMQPSGTVRGIIIAEDVSGSLAKLLVDIGVPPEAPVREEEGKFKPLERVTIPWGPPSDATHSITVSAGNGGSISPSGTVTVNSGTDQTFTIIPNAGYHIKDVKVDGKSVGVVSPYTFTNVTGDHTIEVTFEINTYTVKATAGSGGSISPSGTITVNSGDSKTFTITPNLGYKISDVQVDGKSVGVVSSYTFDNITSDYTIEAKFEPITFTITASASLGGSITPSGTITVNSGDSKTFSITPATSYKIKDVKVDGVSVGSVSSYTFTNITSNHTIEATFEKNVVPPSQTVIILRIGSTIFTVNGVSNTLDSPPVIKNGRTLLPIRAIIESLGGTVGWDSSEKKVTVTLGSTTIELWIGKSIAKVNGVDTPIDSSNSKVVPEIINSRTMLPLRFVTENLGCDVQWNGTTKTITITYKEG